MKFLEYDASKMVSVGVVKEAAKELVGMYITYFWANYNRGEFFRKVFKGFKEEVKETVKEGHLLECDYIATLYKKGINNYEYDIDMYGTDDGDYAVTVKWDYDRLKSIIIALDGKELDDAVVFDWRVGDAIFKCIATCVVREPWRFGPVKEVKM